MKIVKNVSGIKKYKDTSYFILKTNNIISAIKQNYVDDNMKTNKLQELSNRKLVFEMKTRA